MAEEARGGEACPVGKSYRDRIVISGLCSRNLLKSTLIGDVFALGYGIAEDGFSGSSPKGSNGSPLVFDVISFAKVFATLLDSKLMIVHKLLVKMRSGKGKVESY
jgi:hypothetical protein